MNNDINFFSEINEMNAEIDALNPKKRNRQRKSQNEEIPQENQLTEFDAMLNDIEDAKQSGDFPRDVSFDLTIKQSNSRRGDHAEPEKYKGLKFGDLYDVIVNKYR